jgi:hypothetical protein
LNVHIGTIAGVKGETHLATLVLESYAGRTRCYDLQEALWNIAKGTPFKVGASEQMRNLYRHLYVAASRPSRLLCLAMNVDHVEEEQLELLASKGWIVAFLESTTKTLSIVNTAEPMQ